jgi:hypothetical protein
MTGLEGKCALGELNAETERFSFNLGALNVENSTSTSSMKAQLTMTLFIDYHHVEVGDDEPETLHQAVEDMLTNAINTGILSEAGNARLKQLVQKHRDI